ncbi:hypothetical protein [Mesorhizobium loti]|uniref:hypothetical protein n=1 Tax=Rhizobium loti TaxID=381 RepID=UPI0012BD6F61|nr:hypothetical protein [Mesorhizobium loti]
MRQKPLFAQPRGLGFTRLTFKVNDRLGLAGGAFNPVLVLGQSGHGILLLMLRWHSKCGPAKNVPAAKSQYENDIKFVFCVPVFGSFVPPDDPLFPSDFDQTPEPDGYMFLPHGVEQFGVHRFVAPAFFATDFRPDLIDAHIANDLAKLLGLVEALDVAMAAA